MERTSSPIIPLLLFWRKASASSIKRRTLQGSMVQRKHKIINEMMHYHPYSTFLTSSATPTPCLPSDFINHYLSLFTLIPPLPHYHITLPPHTHTTPLLTTTSPFLLTLSYWSGPSQTLCVWQSLPPFPLEPHHLQSLWRTPNLSGEPSSAGSGRACM